MSDRCTVPGCHQMGPPDVHYHLAPRFGPLDPVVQVPTPAATEDEPTTVAPDDGIRAPSHYVDGRKYEPRRVIEDWGLNFNAGNVLKYIARYLTKGGVKDLRKAAQYIQFEIERLEGE